MKNSLMTFSLKEIVPTFSSIFYSIVGINIFDIHEKHDLNREIRKTRGFMKTQGFRPSPKYHIVEYDTLLYLEYYLVYTLLYVR